MTEQLYTNIPPLRPCMCGHGDHYQINGRCLTSGCGCAGRTIDKSGASEAEFRASIAVPDAAPTPPECDPERVETVARALWEHDQPGATPWAELFPTSPTRDRYRRLAAAAIAADPSPAEEAVKRVEVVLGALADSSAEAEESGYRATIDARLVESRLRAALASPAPAPQGGGQR